MSSRVNHLDPECLQAVELARLALPEGEKLDVPRLLDALYHATSLREDPVMSNMAGLFPEPVRLHESPPPAPVDVELKRILVALRNSHPGPVKPMELFGALMRSDSGMRLVLERGLATSGLQEALQEALADAVKVRVAGAAPPAPVPPVHDEKRQRSLSQLRDYGSVLTAPPGPPLSGSKVVSDALMRALLQYLYVPRNRNILLLAPPGTGKTSLIHTLAHKIIARDPVLPPALADLDLFELSPLFPRLADPSLHPISPQEDFRHARRLFQLLENAPGVVLVIDRLVSFLHLLYRLSAHQELMDEFRS